MNRSFNVIVDTREKKPWDLTNPSILELEYRKLDTGDYSIPGYEDQFCIDRKMSVAEIAGNINQKRFHKELGRMKSMSHAYILLEASCTEVLTFPASADLPQRIRDKIKVSGAYILKCIARMEVKYGVHFVFCGNRANAQTVAIALMKEFLEHYEKE